MQNVNVSNFKKDLFNYLNQAIDYGSVINIATKNGNAVLISEDEFYGLQETAHINSFPGLAESILKGAATPSGDLVEVDWENELHA